MVRVNKFNPARYKNQAEYCKILESSGFVETFNFYDILAYDKKVSDGFLGLEIRDIVVAGRRYQLGDGRYVQFEFVALEGGRYYAVSITLADFNRVFACNSYEDIFGRLVATERNSISLEEILKGSSAGLDLVAVVLESYARMDEKVAKEVAFWRA